MTNGQVDPNENVIGNLRALKTGKPFHLHPPLHVIQATYTVLTADGVQKVAENSHTDTGAARAGGSDVTTPLIGVGVVPEKRN